MATAINNTNLDRFHNLSPAMLADFALGLVADIERIAPRYAPLVDNG